MGDTLKTGLRSRRYINAPIIISYIIDGNKKNNHRIEDLKKNKQNQTWK